MSDRDDAIIASLHPSFLHRIPGRSSERGDITHLLVSQMNRSDRRLVASDARRHPFNYRWAGGFPTPSPAR
jgi:hypothetical protein